MLKKISKTELILYTIAVFIALVGFVFMLLGIIADNLSVDSSLYKAQANFSWRYLGLIIIGCAIIFFITVLCVYAKKVDRVTDKELRRKQRLSAMMADLEKKEEIVVSEGKIVEDHSPKEEEKEEEVVTKPINETPKVEETPQINPSTINDTPKLNETTSDEVANNTPINETPKVEEAPQINPTVNTEANKTNENIEPNSTNEVK